MKTAVIIIPIFLCFSLLSCKDNSINNYQPKFLSDLNSRQEIYKKNKVKECRQISIYYQLCFIKPFHYVDTTFIRNPIDSSLYSRKLINENGYITEELIYNDDSILRGSKYYYNNNRISMIKINDNSQVTDKKCFETNYFYDSNNNILKTISSGSEEPNEYYKYNNSCYKPTIIVNYPNSKKETNKPKKIVIIHNNLEKEIKQMDPNDSSINYMYHYDYDNKNRMIQSEMKITKWNYYQKTSYHYNLLNQLDKIICVDNFSYHESIYKYNNAGLLKQIDFLEIDHKGDYLLRLSKNLFEYDYY
jgi:hypothetical protein